MGHPGHYTESFLLRRMKSGPAVKAADANGKMVHSTKKKALKIFILDSIKVTMAIYQVEEEIFLSLD